MILTKTLTADSRLDAFANISVGYSPLSLVKHLSFARDFSELGLTKQLETVHRAKDRVISGTTASIALQTLISELAGTETKPDKIEAAKSELQSFGDSVEAAGDNLHLAQGAFNCFARTFDNLSSFRIVLGDPVQMRELVQDPRIQMPLVAISEVRRDVWRTIENITALLNQSKNGMLGFFNPAADLNKIIDGAIQEEKQAHYLRYRAVKIDFLKKENLPRILIDQARVTNCFRELIRNAAFACTKEDTHPVNRAYTPHPNQTANVHIDLSFDANSKLLIASISDNGIGMNSAIAERISLYSYTNSCNGVQFGGRGVGVPSSFLTIFEHAGSVQLNSEINRGTTLKLHFPLENLT